MEFEVKNGLRAIINETNNTASIVKSPKATGDVFIPRFVEKGNIQYKIISIGEKAFQDCKINSLTFPEDSEIETFESSCFINARIKKLQIPSSVKKIDGCFNIIKELTKIELSPNNQHFIILNNRFLLGKSNDDNDKFDVLYFGTCNIIKAMIPAQISIIKGYSFYQHKNLKYINFEANSQLKTVDNYAFSLTQLQTILFPASVEVIGSDSFNGTPNLVSISFPSDSKLQKVEKKAFANSKIKSISLPASVEYIDDDCFVFTPDLCTINVSPENKFFKLIDGNYIVKESVHGSGIFDVIVVARRNLERIKIPSHIKVINNSAFYNCNKVKNIKFEQNSSLEILQDYVFYFFTLEKFVFPPSLKEVGVQSFYGNVNLKYMEFLSKSITIKKHCFYNCKKLSTVIFTNADQIVFEDGAMFATPNNMKIIVRKSAQVSGDGLNDCKNKIHYIEGDEIMKMRNIEEVDDDEDDEEEESKEAEDEEEQINEVEIEEEQFNDFENDDNILVESISIDIPELDILVDEIFDYPIIIDELNKKPYEEFVPTISFHIEKSIKDIEFDKLQELLGENAVILNIDLSPTNLHVALLSIKGSEHDLQEKLDEYKKEMTEKFQSPAGQSIVGNLVDEPIIHIPDDADIVKAVSRSLSGNQQYIRDFDETEIGKIRRLAIRRLQKDINMYNWQFYLNNKDLYNQMEEQIRKVLEENPYEMVISNQTIFANKFMSDYEQIKSQIPENEIEECFLFHGQMLKKCEDRGYLGFGSYATDNPFFAAIPSNAKSLDINQNAQIVCCRAIFNKANVEKVTNNSYSKQPINSKVANNFGCNQAFVGNSTGFLPFVPNKKAKNIITANEFVFANKLQLIPLCSFTVVRKDHYILWKDENINSAQNQKYLKQWSENIDVNFYAKDSVENALNVINNKKFASVLLVTNAGGEKQTGKTLIAEARKIFGKSNFVCLVFASEFSHMNWICKKKNVFFTTLSSDVKKFVELKMNDDEVIQFDESLREKYQGVLDSQKLKFWKTDKKDLLNFSKRKDTYV